MGGSYVGTIKSQDGKLTVPLATGSTLNLHVVKVQLSPASSSVTMLFFLAGYILLWKPKSNVNL